MMKRYIILLIGVVLFSCKDQTSETKIPEDQPSSVKTENNSKDQILNAIRNRFSTIEKQRKNAKLDTTSFTYNCYNEKSGSVIFYTENDSLRLIEHRYNEYSHHEATDWYYIENDQPYFIFYDRLDWSFDGQSQNENDTKESITETRIYLKDGKILKCLQKKFDRRGGEAKNSDSIPNSKIDCDEYQDYLSDFKKLHSKIAETGSKQECL